MTGPSPDLDALREWCTLLHRSPIESERALAADLRAVLALVDEQRARISTLERQNATLASSRDLAMRLARNAQERVSDLQSENDRLRLALAGSSAENKETT